MDPALIPLYVAAAGGAITVIGSVVLAVVTSVMKRREQRGEASTMRVPSWPEAFDMISKANQTATDALAEATKAREDATTARAEATEAREEAKTNRSLYETLRSAHDRLRDTFRQYVDRVQAGGSNALTDAERDSLRS